MNKMRPRITEDEWNLLKGIRAQCKAHDIGIENVPDGWLKSKESSLRFKNPAYKPQEQLEREIDFTGVFDSLTPLSLSEGKKRAKGIFDRLVYTDVHVGMEVNPKGRALYGGKWDAEELGKRLEEMVKFTIDNRQSKILHIDDLGDFMDGWNGQTVRKGHDLPQNMDNQKAYDEGVKFKVQLVNALVPYFDKIYCRNICVDNHSGDFGYVVNSAFAMVAKLMHPKKVFVYNQLKFIEHYQVGGYGFMTTHGKDDVNLKFGFKPHLNPDGVKKIENYMNHHGLFEGVVWEFSKGDSHQCLFDECSSTRFKYYNYPAFSPASNWVQTNFTPQRMGFFLFNYYEERGKASHEYYFQ